MDGRPLRGQEGWDRRNGDTHPIPASIRHVSIDRDHLVESERQVGAASTLDGELADERRSVPRDLRVPGHQAINDNVDVGPTVPCGHGAHQLKASKVVPPSVAILLEGFDKPYVFTIAQLRRIEDKVHVPGSELGHVGFAEEQSGYHAAADRGFAV